MPPSDAARPQTPETGSGSDAAASPAAVLAALPHAPREGPLGFFGKQGDPEAIRPALEAAGGRFFDRVVAPDVATRTVTHLAGFHGVLQTRTGTAPPMVVHGDAHGTAYLAVDDDAPPEAYYHELAHLLFDAYGYVTDRGATDGPEAAGDTDAAGDAGEAGDTEATPTAAARERAYRRGEGSDPFVCAPPADAPGASNLELRRADPTVAPKAAAFHPDVASLADAVNASWRAIHRARRDDPGRLSAVLPKPGCEDANVVSVHAHELAAVWAEVFLEDGTPSHPANWFFEHPRLTAAFCRVVRPSDGVCRVANSLHRTFPERSPWDATPFPEMADDEEAAVAAAWAASASTRVGGT